MRRTGHEHPGHWAAGRELRKGAVALLEAFPVRVRALAIALAVLLIAVPLLGQSTLPVSAADGADQVTSGNQRFHPQDSSLPNWIIESIEVLPEGDRYAGETNIEIWVKFNNVGGSGGTTDNSVLITLHVVINTRVVTKTYRSHNPGVRQLVWDEPLPQGDYFIGATIDADENQAESDEWDNSEIVQISVLAPRDTTAPPVPEIYAPEEGEELSDTTPWLNWENVTDPERNGDKFDIEVSTSNSFGSGYVIASRYGTNTSSYTVEDSLLLGQYYWRVRSRDLVPNISAWASSSSIVVEPEDDPPPVPTLTSPASGAEITSLTPTLTWSAVDDPDGATVGYDIQLSTSSSFQPGATYGLISEIPSYTLNTALSGSQHYWRVRARDSAENYSDWSSSRSFTVVMPQVDNTPPSITNYFAISQDLNGTKITHQNITVPSGKRYYSPRHRPTVMANWEESNGISAKR